MLWTSALPRWARTIDEDFPCRGLLLLQGCTQLLCFPAHHYECTHHVLCNIFHPSYMTLSYDVSIHHINAHHSAFIRMMLLILCMHHECLLIVTPRHRTCFQAPYLFEGSTLSLHIIMAIQRDTMYHMRAPSMAASMRSHHITTPASVHHVPTHRLNISGPH